MIPEYKEKNFLTRGFDFLNDPVDFPIKQEEKLGDFFLLNSPLRKIFITHNPEVIKHTLVTNQRDYIKSPAYAQLKLALGNGLVTSEGDFWRRQRRLAQPAFYKKSLLGIIEKMVDSTTSFCESIESKRGEKVLFSHLMMDVTSEIVLKSLFSVENEADKLELYRQIIDAQDYIMYRTTRPLMIPFMYLNGRHRKFLKDKASFDEMAYNFIRQHREAANPPDDFLTMLIHSKDADTGESMSDEEIRDETITLFAAGHETSSNALAWTAYLLSQNPDIYRKVKEEAERVIGNKKPQFADIQQLTYTKQVIEEGMRLYSPAYAVGREAAVDTEVLGTKIPKKSIMFISISAAHRSKKNWKHPNEFDPDRFHPDRVKSIPKYAYMPFGAGQRMCIGNHFAMMEMQLVLAMLCQRFGFEYLGEGEPGYQALVTLKPANDMPMRLI